jgi:hypothetical protein
MEHKPKENPNREDKPELNEDQPELKEDQPEIRKPNPNYGRQTLTMEDKPRHER